MTDVLTPEQRKLNMSRIRNKDTRPEMVVRSLIHRMGYRYRLHVKNLSGKPDLVFPRRRKIIFVHGCFWHMHNCKYGRVKPQTNAEFWQNKRLGNVGRDRKNLSLLKKDGWKVLVVWECWIKNPQSLTNRIIKFLDSPFSSL
jgi:DNA mismatch endonuclease (patch repair protein)